MKIIEIETADKVVLYGCLYGENYKNTCVIITNGTCGNIFENKFLRVVGEKLEQNKISFMYAHNRGAFHRIDTKTGDNNPVGNTYDLFDKCVLDLQAYIDWAKMQGYKHTILGGYSYGANKIVYYLSNHQNEKIDKYVLISPTDAGSFKDHEEESISQLMPVALEYKREGEIG